MDAVVLMDADSSLFQSCLRKKEEENDDPYIQDLSEAAHKFEEKVQGIINTLEDTHGFNVVHTIVFLEGAGNYRYALNKEYKANRKDPKPPLLDDLRRWVIANYKHPQPLSTFLSYNVETDDSVVSTYKKYDGKIDEVLIIASPDKDLKTFPCNLFDSFWSRMELQVISEQEAFKNLMIQMLVGDSADNIKGIPRVGQKTAEKLLKDANEPLSILKVVYSQYIQKFGRNAKKEFYKNYHCLKLNERVATPDLESILF